MRLAAVIATNTHATSWSPCAWAAGTAVGPRVRRATLTRAASRTAKSVTMSYTPNVPATCSTTVNAVVASGSCSRGTGARSADSTG